MAKWKIVLNRRSGSGCSVRVAPSGDLMLNCPSPSMVVSIAGVPTFQIPHSTYTLATTGRFELRIPVKPGVTTRDFEIEWSNG